MSAAEREPDSRQRRFQSLVPNVGEILKRLRLQRNATLREVAESADLSTSFLSAVERGESDLSLGRLARLAQFFDQDLGTLLGFTTRFSTPRYITGGDRYSINRGEGVSFEVLRLPTDFELNLIRVEPHSKFADTICHEGIDIVLGVEGELIVAVDGGDYPIRAGDCVVYSAGYSHTIRNDSNKGATAIGFTTGRMR